MFRMPPRSFVIGGVLLATVGFGSLGIVWIRVEISKVAEDSRRLEKQVSDNARDLGGLNAKRASALNPASLKNLVAGRLIKPALARVYFVKPTEFQRRQNFPPPLFPPAQARMDVGFTQPMALR